MLQHTHYGTRQCYLTVPNYILFLILQLKAISLHVWRYIGLVGPSEYSRLSLSSNV
jgi:hypothetical protein